MLYADKRQLTAVTVQNVLCTFHMMYSEDLTSTGIKTGS